MTTTTEAPAAPGSRWRRISGSMSRAEWSRLGAMAAFIVALHVIGWFTLVAIVAPEHYSLGTKSFGIGIGVTAYTLGMRHAFDADHIAAIDNTTRKLMADGKRPLSVGFWFSLGHSTVVTGLTVGLAFGVKSLGQQLLDDNSPLHSTGGLTVLEAIMLGCPAISYGWGRGHLRLNNRAYRRFGLADVVSHRDELKAAITRSLAHRRDQSGEFSTLPSAASCVLALVDSAA